MRQLLAHLRDLLAQRGDLLLLPVKQLRHRRAGNLLVQAKESHERVQNATETGRRRLQTCVTYIYAQSALLCPSAQIQPTSISIDGLSASVLPLIKYLKVLSDEDRQDSGSTFISYVAAPVNYPLSLHFFWDRLEGTARSG